MSPNQKIWGILASLASLIAIFTFLFNLNETKDSAWRLFKADLMEENADLKKENEGLRRSIAGLKRKNESLTTYIDAYENNIIELKDAARNGNQNQSILPIDLPEQLTKERFEIRQIYRQMIGEKKRWDQYQQDQYKTILESVIEPAVIESQGLYLDVEENIDYFLEPQQ